MHFSNGHFYSVNQYYKELFGTKIYKISLDAGCTCPNRDGTKGLGGCIFCGESGSGDFAANRFLSVKNQVEQGKSLVSGKIKSAQNVKYIAYFQNFTSTYGDENILVQKYKEALSSKDVVGLALGTRPDCISDKMLEMLSELAKKYYVSIELGLQTSNEKTSEYIRRKYKNEIYLQCIKRINQKADIHIVTHLIFGLPFETEKDMLDSVRFSVAAGTDGIKISLLHVLKNTDLQKEFESGKFSAMEMYDYFYLLGKAVEIIPEHIVLHRITGDGAKKNLIAPMWTGNKRFVLNELNKYLCENNIVQGKKSESAYPL